MRKHRTVKRCPYCGKEFHHGWTGYNLHLKHRHYKVWIYGNKHCAAEPAHLWPVRKDLDQPDSVVEPVHQCQTLTYTALVSEPTHYREGEVECIDAIRAALGIEGFRAYCKGNVMKYLWREQHKGGQVDVQKAQKYLEWLVDTPSPVEDPE